MARSEGRDGKGRISGRLSPQEMRDAGISPGKVGDAVAQLGAEALDDNYRRTGQNTD